MAERNYKPSKKVKEPKKKSNYKFSDKQHSKMGIVSAIIGAVNLLIMIVATYISSQSHGKGELDLGLYGMIAFILSVTGLYYAIKSVDEKEIFYTFPIIGIVLNGLLLIGCILLYLIGLA